MQNRPNKSVQLHLLRLFCLWEKNFMLYNDGQKLEQSSVVANCCMNRERDLSGTNGYDVEIGF